MSGAGAAGLRAIHSRSRGARVVAALVGAGLLVAAPAAAQDDAPSDSAAADSAAIELEPLVIDAMPLPLPVLDLPYAAGVVQGPALELVRATGGLADLLHAVPGVQAHNRYNDALGDRLSVRGMGARAAFGVRGVHVLIDGIPATLPDGQTDLSRLDGGAVDRIEVLRGPASSVYGNAAGGVLLFSSEAPPDVPLAQELELSGGGELWQGRARVAGRSGAYGYDAVLVRRSNDGFRDFSDSDRLHAWFAGSVQAHDDRIELRVSFTDYDALNPGALSAEQLAQDRTQAHGGNIAQRTGERARHAVIGAHWQRPVQGGQLEVGGYGLARSLENPIPPVIIDVERRVAGVHAAYRRSIGALEWTGGLEAGLQHDDRLNHENEGGERARLTLSQVETVASGAAFAQARLPVTRRLDVMGGLRYDRFRFEADDRLTDGDPDDSGVRLMGAFSPSVGLLARVAHRLHLYGNAATSFETPTTTELANRPDGAGGFNPALGPQRALALEAGAKGVTARVRYDLGLHRTTLDDALVPFEVPDASGRQFYRNAGRLVHQGVEAAATLAWPRRMEWRAAYTWLDARFDEYEVDGVSYAGKRVPGVAPHRLESSAAYRSPAATVALYGEYSSGMHVSDANTAGTATEPYALVSARGEVRVLRDAPLRLSLLLGVENLLDRDYVSSVVVNAFGGRFYEPGPGRTLRLGLRAGFHGP